MAYTSSFSKAEYNQFVRLNDMGYPAAKISQLLKIDVETVERSIANLTSFLEKEKEKDKLTPAQKGAKTRAEKKAKAEKAKANEVSDEVDSPFM